MKEKFIAILEEENKNEALNIINEKDEFGNTLLMYAVLGCSDDFIEFLIQNGADINTINNKGDNALLKVLDNQTRIDIDVAKILINNGIDINYSFNADMTPLMLACALGGQSNKIKSILDNADSWDKLYTMLNNFSFSSLILAGVLRITIAIPLVAID